MYSLLFLVDIETTHTHLQKKNRSNNELITIDPLGIISAEYM